MITGGVLWIEYGTDDVETDSVRAKNFAERLAQIAHPATQPPARTHCHS